MSDLPKVAKVYLNNELRPVILYKRGHKFTKAAVQTGVGVKTVKLKNRDADKAPDALYKAQPYPVKRALALFRKSAVRGTMNQEIRELLYGDE